jgi:hypothetical protein
MLYLKAPWGRFIGHGTFQAMRLILTGWRI